MVFLSEGEKAIVEFANFLHTGKPAVSEIKGVS
jgi:hypothetical protein